MVSDLFGADWIKGRRQGLWKAKSHLHLTHQESSRMLGYLLSSISLAAGDRHTTLGIETNLGSEAGVIRQG